MTKLAYLSLQSLIKEKIQDLVLNKKATSIALGVAISRFMPLPSSEVNSAEEHYTQLVVNTASEMVTGFNEEIVVDVDLTMETARGYWLVRYFNAYPSVDGSLASAGECDFLLKLAGSMRFLNADTRAYCDQNSELMISLVNRITLVLKPQEQEPA